jgi:hypothetical protein
MSTKASIAHPVTRVALDDTVAVHSRREAQPRRSTRPPVNFRDHHQRSLASSSPSPTRSATSSTRAV